MTTTAFFRTDQLTVGYDGNPLISDIDVSLEKGTILSLIGPNGSGKTTILKSIAKYLKTITGTVYIEHDSILDMSNRDLSYKLSVVLTERLQTELMTCEDVVATGRYPYTGRFGILGDVDHQHVREAMEQVSAWDLKNRDFRQISDGQRQRILLARAICQQPEVIVLDEPTSYLDARYKLDILTILHTMAKEHGITVIMSLHELDMAQKVSDLVMCVKGDRISRIGAPEEIFTDDGIDTIFDLAPGTYNPLFGSLEFDAPLGEPHVFVVAGGGAGVEHYRRLQRRGIPFVTGVLHRNDVDYQIATRLASEVFSEESFEPISDAVMDAATKRLVECDTLVECPHTYGTINSRNKALVELAKARGLRTVTSAEEVDEP